MQDLTSNIEGYIVCARSYFLITHNVLRDSYRLEIITQKNEFVYLEDEHIVHFDLLSDFTPYFTYMDPQSFELAAGAVFKLVTETVKYTIEKATYNSKAVPAKLKKLYAKTLRTLRRFYQGSFVTDVFMKKLWRLVQGSWSNVVTYKNWNSTKSIPISLATDVCS